MCTNETPLVRRWISTDVVITDSSRTSFSGTEAFHKVAEASDDRRPYFGRQPMLQTKNLGLVPRSSCFKDIVCLRDQSGKTFPLATAP